MEAVRAYGRVAWRNRDEFGVVFEVPLDRHEVALLRKAGAQAGTMPPDMKLARDVWMGRSPG